MSNYLAALGLVLLSIVSPARADWTSFRGPGATGSVEGADWFAGHDDVRLKVRWKIPLGSGYSGPVVAGGRVYTQAADGEHDVLWAHDATTGRKLWRFEMGPSYTGHDGSHDGPIATPVIAGKRVIGLSAYGRLFALEAASGELVWSVDLIETHGATKPHYGFCSSPLLVSGVLVLPLGLENGFLAGFDPATGEKLWATGAAQLAYQSPSITVDGGRELVLAAGGDNLLAIDPADGKLAWSYSHSGDGGRGAASLTAVPTEPRHLFLAHKDDGSKLVRWSDSGGGKGEGAKVETIWENRVIRNSYNIPVYADGTIYAFSSRFLTAVDEATGEARWRSREPGDGFLARVDDHLVVATKAGTLHIVEASPEAYREAAAVTLFDDLIWSPPAISDGSIFVRGLGGLARVDVRAGASGILTRDRDGEPPSGSRFRRFLRKVEKAKEEEKEAVIEGFLSAQESLPIVEAGWVHFVFRGDASDVAIGGDLIGSRQDRPMHRVAGTDLFRYSLPMAEDARVEYVFIPDFGEAVTDPQNPRQIVSSSFGVDMERPRQGPGLTMSWVAGPAWKAPDYLDEAELERRGRIDEQVLAVEELDLSVKLHVWLPPGYDPDGERRYPVLFVAGGESALESGRFETVLANLVDRRVEPAIAVFLGIPGRDLSVAADVFADHVVPFVDESYRTVAGREGRTLLGHSFAGFGAVLTGVKRPETVARVSVQSLHVLDFMLEQLTPLLAEHDSRPSLRVDLEWSRYDARNPHEAWDMREYNERVAEMLEERGIQVDRHLTSEGPGWTGWTNRVGAVLERILGSNRGS